MSYLVLPLIERGEWGGKCGWAAYDVGELIEAMSFRKSIFESGYTLREAIWDGPVPFTFESNQLDGGDVDDLSRYSCLPDDRVDMDFISPDFVMHRDGYFWCRAYDGQDNLIETDAVYLEDVLKMAREEE